MGNSAFYYCPADQTVEDKRDPGRSRPSHILIDEHRDKEIWCHKCKQPRLFGNPPSFEYKFCPKCGGKLLNKEDYDRRNRRKRVPQVYNDLDPAPIPRSDFNNVQMIDGDPVMPTFSDSEVDSRDMNRADTFSDDDDPFGGDNGGGTIPQTVSNDSVTEMRFRLQEMQRQQENAATSSFPKKDPASQR